MDNMPKLTGIMRVVITHVRGNDTSLMRKRRRSLDALVIEAAVAKKYRCIAEPLGSTTEKPLNDPAQVDQEIRRTMRKLIPEWISVKTPDG